MSPHRVVALSAAFLVLSAGAETQSQPVLHPQVRQTSRPVLGSFRASQDGSRPLVELDFVDGQAADADNSEPDLTIYGDGSVRVYAANTNQGILRGQIPRAELQALLQDLLVNWDLTRCETAQLSREIDVARRQLQRPIPGPEAALTIIRIYGETEPHEVRCHALGLTANQFLHLPDLQNLFLAEQRLSNVMAIIRGGGYEVVEHAANLANHQLLQRLPSAPPLSCRHLSFAIAHEDGSRFLQFSRFEPVSAPTVSRVPVPPAVEGMLLVSVMQSPGQSPQISITTN